MSRQSAECFPVGHFIQEEMDARGWTIDDLLNRMPGDREKNALWLDLLFADFDIEIQKVSRMGESSALDHAFGTTAGYWERIDQSYHDFINRQ